MAPEVYAIGLDMALPALSHSPDDPAACWNALARHVAAPHWA